MKLTITRKRLYSGPLTRGKKYAYIAQLDGETIASAETRDAAETQAYQTLLDAFQCRSNHPIATTASDGTIIISREYAPGQVETIYQRRIDGGNGSCMGRMEIDCKPIKLREYHAHFVVQYETAICRKAV